MKLTIPTGIAHISLDGDLLLVRRPALAEIQTKINDWYLQNRESKMYSHTSMPLLIVRYNDYNDHHHDVVNSSR